MATRLYFPVGTDPEVLPAISGWGYTTEVGRGILAHVKGTSPITAGTLIGPWTAGLTALDRQYVSAPMNGGHQFTTSSTFKGVLMVREGGTQDNVDKLKVKILVVSRDGQTVRATLKALNHYHAAAEFIANASHRNQLMHGTGGTVLDANYTTVLGDRLVVELGYSDAAGTTPEAGAKWGENAADAAENNTGTTDAAGWIEFSNNLTFEAVAATAGIMMASD